MMFRFTTPSLPQRPYAFAAIRDPQVRAVHNAAAAMEPQLRDAFMRIMGDVKSEFRLTQITDAIWRSSVSDIIRLLPLNVLEEELTGAHTALLRELMQRAGESSIQFIPNAAGALSFDLLNPRAVDWLAVNAAELVTNVSDSVKDAIRYVTLRGFVDGIPPREQAVFIRDMVGLLPRHATAVYNYRARLLADDVRPRRVETLVKEYTERLLDYRGNMIARTETIRSSSMGQQELWWQAEEQGFLDPNKTVRKWLVTHDDRLSKDRCKPMEGQLRKLNEEFITGLGARVMTPPAGPHCRCGMRLVFLD